MTYCFKMILILTGLFLTGFSTGCFSPERDNVQDPYNTPLFRFFDATYEAANGTVLIQWEYLSRGTPEGFEVNRRFGSETEMIGFIDGRDISETDQGIASFQDSTLAVGQVATYWVLAIGSGSGRARTALKTVKVPGMYLQEVSSHLANGSIHVRWDGDPNEAVGYELFKSILDGPEILVFRTQDLAETTFEDADIQGNTSYTYTVHTLMANGVRLKSRPVSGSVYGLGASQRVADTRSSVGRVRLFTNSEAADAVLALVTSPDDAFFQRCTAHWSAIGTDVRILLSRSWPAPIADLVPASVSTAGSTSRQASQGIKHGFAAGIHPKTGQVVLKGIGSSSYTPVFSVAWESESPAARTALSLDTRGQLFMSAGQRLRVFDEQVRERGTATIDVGEPWDLMVSAETLWAIFPDVGRLLRGEMAFENERLVRVAWRDMPLPPGTVPVSLTRNHLNQVLVLDAANARMLVLSPEGQFVLNVPLPGQNLARGDLKADSSKQLIHLVDGNGMLYTLRP